MKRRIWANLIQLGTNLWDDHEASDTLQFDDRVWTSLTERSAAIGMNMVVIDLGEGLVYPSHPELAVKGSWTPERLGRELKRLRAMGLEPIPKVNFSAKHDAWLGDYARMVSTKPYYTACAEIIADVIRLFDHPRFVHLGMDEEAITLQASHYIGIARMHDLWFHDVQFLIDEVVKGGSRPWVWADPAWFYTDYPQRMDKRAVQSNWFYWNTLPELEKKVDLPPPPDEKRPTSARHNPLVELRTFLDLERARFDQIPSGTNWDNPENMGMVVDFCTRRIPEARLLGFLMEPWKNTIAEPKALAVHDEFFRLLEPIIRRYGA